MYNDTPLSYFTCVHIDDRAEGLTWALTALYSTAYRAHTASGPSCVHIEDRAEGLTWTLTALYSTAYRAHTASGPSCVHIEDRAKGLTWTLTALYSTTYRAHTASGPACVHKLLLFFISKIMKSTLHIEEVGECREALPLRSLLSLLMTGAQKIIYQAVKMNL